MATHVQRMSEELLQWLVLHDRCNCFCQRIRLHSFRPNAAQQGRTWSVLACRSVQPAVVLFEYLAFGVRFHDIQLRGGVLVLSGQSAFARMPISVGKVESRQDFCGGCSKMNGGKTACEVCSGGFTKTSRRAAWDVRLVSVSIMQLYIVPMPVLVLIRTRYSTTPTPTLLFQLLSCLVLPRPKHLFKPQTKHCKAFPEQTKTL